MPFKVKFNTIIKYVIRHRVYHTLLNQVGDGYVIA
jgi:hypothetical protein